VYYQVTLSRNGKSNAYLVHRLVGIAFIPNPDNKPEINHKDGNKQNNLVDNLEWVTPVENQNHSVATGLKQHGELAANSKLTAKDVEEIRLLYTPNKRGFGCRSLGKRFGVNPGTIWNIVNNKYWKWD
jgi:hypothetical protein